MGHSTAVNGPASRATTQGVEASGALHPGLAEPTQEPTPRRDGAGQLKPVHTAIRVPSTEQAVVQPLAEGNSDRACERVLPHESKKAPQLPLTDTGP